MLADGRLPKYNQAQVQKPGEAIRIRLSVVRNSLTQSIAVQKLLLGYQQALMTHLSQVSVCHKHQTLVQQFARLLLLVLERQDDDTIEMTHELMARLLGVRRESVSNDARKLMQENILNYSRGKVHVVNPKHAGHARLRVPQHHPEQLPTVFSNYK